MLRLDGPLARLARRMHLQRHVLRLRHEPPVNEHLPRAANIQRFRCPHRWLEPQRQNGHNHPQPLPGPRQFESEEARACVDHVRSITAPVPRSSPRRAAPYPCRAEPQTDAVYAGCTPDAHRMHNGLRRVHPVCIRCASLVHEARQPGTVSGWGGLGLRRYRLAIGPRPIYLPFSLPVHCLRAYRRQVRPNDFVVTTVWAY